MENTEHLKFNAAFYCNALESVIQISVLYCISQ